MVFKRIIIGILFILLVITAVYAFILYNDNNQLKSRNNQLEADRAQLNTDKENIIIEREQCRNDSQNLQSQLKMLQEDVNKIYKGCIADNICKGHYPGIRWTCNNVGDQATDATASHICVCDSTCQLNATAIVKS